MSERGNQIYAEAVEAYDRIGDPHSRAIVAVVDAVRPLIAADTLREAASAAEQVSIVYDQDSDDGWRRWMRERADAIERGEVRDANG